MVRVVKSRIKLEPLELHQSFPTTDISSRRKKKALLSAELMKEIHFPHQGHMFKQTRCAKIKPQQSHCWFDSTALIRHKLVIN